MVVSVTFSFLVLASIIVINAELALSKLPIVDIVHSDMVKAMASWFYSRLYVDVVAIMDAIDVWCISRTPF